MERCPNCRARLEGGAQHCRRCGMELGLLRDTERAAAALLERAVAALAGGDQRRARVCLERARALSADELAGQLLGFLDEPRSSAAAPDSRRHDGASPAVAATATSAGRRLRPVAHRHRYPAPAQRGPGKAGA